MAERKNTAVHLQLALALFILGMVIWEAADFVKLFLFRGAYAGLNPWAAQFYNPHKGAIVNYILSCFGLGIAGIAVYFRRWDSGIFTKIADGTQKSSARLFLTLFLLTLADTALRSEFGPEAFYKLTLLAIPLLYTMDRGLLKKMAPAAVLLVLFFLCLEPARVAMGPARLMNEYAGLYGETLLDGVYVSNRDFAEYHSRGIPVQGEKKFLESNYLELFHQAITRGQINHIGHILNPINEYLAGKPLRDIQMQYGLGDTMLMKWTMDLFGGLSIQNYYKCYAYYIIYYVLSLLMLVYIFRNAGYVLGCLCALAASHFSYGYIGFILAPGIIPTIHFFDIFVIACLTAYLRSPGKTGRLALAFLAAAAGAMLNRQFGGILTAALTMTTLFYCYENKSGRARNTLTAAILTSFFLIVALSGFVTALSGAGSLKMYISGFFSWEPYPALVVFTVIYLTSSYIFFARLKTSRSYLKYLYLFLFLYSQGLFVYFYWSGLVNHLPMVTPFIALQLFTALFLVESETLSRDGALSPGFSRLKQAVFVLVLACLPLSATRFYLGMFGERTFAENFDMHRKYAWNSNRARLISTIDPQPLKESLSQIGRYSGGENGIYILSQYDNLIPLLSGKYSRFQFFELPWYLVTAEAGMKSAALLERDKPEHIFVDNDIPDEKPDLWTLSYGADRILSKENESRLGRLKELRKIFRSVSSNYTLVEKGPLLSVYRLKPVKGRR